MPNITYLLGAGASANTIPVVNDLMYRFDEIIGFLNQYESLNEQAYEGLPLMVKEHRKKIKEIIDDIKWLRGEAGHHQTIDTLAKKFYLIKSDELKRLKKTLIAYFTLEQLLSIHSGRNENYKFIKGKELRYDSFFAAILNGTSDGNLSVRPNVKILTWNYDQQIELALKTYVQKEVNFIKETYQIFPNEKTLQSQQPINFDPQAFAVVKLNGNAFWHSPTITGSDYSLSLFDNNIIDNNKDTLLGYTLKEYDLISRMNNGKSLNESLSEFNFSWESDQAFTDKYAGYYHNREIARGIAERTEYLVVIGYSFPVFNRQADKFIIDSMKSIRKVYIQDPNAEAIKSTMENGFDIFKNNRDSPQYGIPFQLEKSTYQFLIPFEL